MSFLPTLWLQLNKCETLSQRVILRQESKQAFIQQTADTNKTKAQTLRRQQTQLRHTLLETCSKLEDFDTDLYASHTMIPYIYSQVIHLLTIQPLKNSFSHYKQPVCLCPWC